MQDRLGRGLLFQCRGKTQVPSWFGDMAWLFHPAPWNGFPEAPRKPPLEPLGGTSGHVSLLPSQAPVEGIAILRQFPFSSSLLRMSVITREQGQEAHELHMKGAPETVASFCKPETGREQRPRTPCGVATTREGGIHSSELEHASGVQDLTGMSLVAYWHW